MRVTKPAPPFPKTTRRLAPFVLISLLMSACQPASASTLAPSAAPTSLPIATATPLPTAGPTTAPPTVPPTTATPAATSAPLFNEPGLSVFNHPTLGEILVGDNGMTLYIFTQDQPNQSNCTAACLEFWPPLRTQGNPKLGPGLDPALVGSVALPDGSLIVTYNRMPLYYFYLDSQPGDAAGLGLEGAWFALTPGGSMVRPPLESQPTSAPSNEKKEKDNDYGSDY